MSVCQKAAGIWAVLGVLEATVLGAGVEYVPSRIRPPAAPREFRGVWVASVGNIDWPSKPGLSSEEQKKELRGILVRASKLRLNAVILQVRPGGDALYASSHEPWSEYLSGRMGQGPRPFYDPLAFAVEEAHKLGLELHAWFNPFRARHHSAKSRVSATHMSRAHPELVVRYGPYLWMDPGERLVQEHSLRVILDVLRRYDVDGIHLDDYFYPYPEKSASGTALPFPDQRSWARYVRAGGKLAREDWRRANVDRFVERLYGAIKKEKPWVKFGISPFGIWRPGHPSSVEGFDAFAGLYADSRKWLVQGWLDYCAPQLYWPIGQAGQSYSALLEWWSRQNPKQRHLWPGTAIARIGPTWPVDEIVRQVNLCRQTDGVTGQVFWNFSALQENRGGVSGVLSSRVYPERALVPSTPWLGRVQPAPPKGGLSPGSPWKLRWKAGEGEGAWLWVVQMRQQGRWSMEVLPGRQTSLPVGGPLPEVVSVVAVDRVGNCSAPLVLERRTTPH